MKAYLICGSCGRHENVEFEGTIRCPHCNSKKVKRLAVGDTPPEWFEKTKQEDK